jgi:hypothetical protein
LWASLLAEFDISGKNIMENYEIKTYHERALLSGQGVPLLQQLAREFVDEHGFALWFERF